MTKEILDIVGAFKAAQQQGRQTALATVVHVEGSSYRRPGARMLIEDNGKMTGAISGGCLEGDALRKALLAINQRQNKLVTYDTSHEDENNFGVQLGCNGIVHILFEPIDVEQINNPIALLQKCALERKEVAVVTLFSVKNYYGAQPGTCYLYDGGAPHSNIEDNSFEIKIRKDAAFALASKSSFLKEYNEHDFSAFVELIEPPVSLVIVGAGNDALPVAEMAMVLGWQITVVDGRATHANKQRFPAAYKIIVANPVEARKQMIIDERTVFLLMTHNYNYDLAMMEVLLQDNCTYIGTLGPKKRLQRMLAELQDRGSIIANEQIASIYGPTGLDIGAETAEEIALSVLAEIKAVLAERQGAFLRDRPSEIHSRAAYVNIDRRIDV
jgi:xanthine dehydrogenase accessory factor